MNAGTNKLGCPLSFRNQSALVVCLLSAVLLRQPAAADEQMSEAAANGAAVAAVANIATEEPVRKRGSNVSIAVTDEGVQPKDIIVNAGTTLVWINEGTKPVRVRFTTHAVSTTCKAPRNFTLGPKGIYVSETLRAGEVASICIMEPNVYEYQAEPAAADTDSMTAKLGRVRVQNVRD